MNIGTPTTSANRSASISEFEDDIQDQGIMTHYNDPNNLIFNGTTKELKGNDMIYDVIGVVFNPADSVRSSLPNNTSCILTRYGIYVIKVSELEVGTWLRCDVENKNCGVRYVIAAKPIYSPIHTRCIFKYNDADLMFFGKLKFDVQSKKFKCSFLGDLIPTFPNCSETMEVFAEYMLNAEGKLEIKKVLDDAEKTKLFKDFFLPTELSLVQKVDNTMNSKVCVLWARNKLIDANFNTSLKNEQKAAVSVLESRKPEPKTSPIKQFEKPSVFNAPSKTANPNKIVEQSSVQVEKSSVFNIDPKTETASPSKQPSVFNIDPKTETASPSKQPSVFNAPPKTSQAKQVEQPSVFNAPPKTSPNKIVEQPSAFNIAPKIIESPSKQPSAFNIAPPKTSPNKIVEQPSVFNAPSKISPNKTVEQPSAFNAPPQTSPVKQINGNSVFTESSNPKTTASPIKQTEQKPQVKQGFVKKAPLIEPNGTNSSDKRPEISNLNQVDQTSNKMNKISISSNKISLMAFSEQPKVPSAFNTHHEPTELHVPKPNEESSFSPSTYSQQAPHEVIRRPGPRPVPMRGGLYFPVVRTNGRSVMLNGQRIEQMENEHQQAKHNDYPKTSLKKSSSEESDSFEDDLDKYLSK